MMKKNEKINQLQQQVTNLTKQVQQLLDSINTSKFQQRSQQLPPPVQQTVPTQQPTNAPVEISEANLNLVINTIMERLQPRIVDSVDMLDISVIEPTSEVQTQGDCSFGSLLTDKENKT